MDEPSLVLRCLPAWLESLDLEEGRSSHKAGNSDVYY